MKRKAGKLCVLLLFTSCYSILYAQNDPKIGGWYTANLKARVSDKWTLSADYQMRSDLVADNFFYLDYKLQASYKLNSKWQIGGGIGRYVSYNDAFNFRYLKSSESRIWQQLSFSESYRKLKIDHRLRSEQRFFTNEYENRFRYRLQINHPLKKFTGDKLLYATAYDEVFFTNEPPHFLRNRFHAGLGFQLSKSFELQLGLLNQSNFGDNFSDSKNFLALSLLYSIDFRKGS